MIELVGTALKLRNSMKSKPRVGMRGPFKAEMKLLTLERRIISLISFPCLSVFNKWWAVPTLQLSISVTG